MKLAGEEGVFCCSLQISQHDILNPTEREMSGDLREGMKTVDKRKISFTEVDKMFSYLWRLNYSELHVTRDC